MLPSAPRSSPACAPPTRVPTTELEYASVFQLLVAVILSAQATDKGVNSATRKLYADAPTPQAILALGEDGLIEYINRIGLYRNKAKNVIATCRS
jgi:endonuclease-3